MASRSTCAAPCSSPGLLLLMLDGLLVFWLSGGFGALLPRRRATAALLLALGVAAAIAPAASGPRADASARRHRS